MVNKLNKLSASHGAALFLFCSLFSSKSLEKSSTKMFPFNSFFSDQKVASLSKGESVAAHCVHSST